MPLTLAQIADEGDRLAREYSARPTGPLRGLIGCRAAELLKRVGDLRADGLFRSITSDDPGNAEYHLLYGDYLRNYRGPGQALVGRAAAQYYKGLATADTSVANLIRRSLVALYERDGLPVAADMGEGPPRFLFSSQNQGARSPDDISNVDMIRAVTSAALFAASGDNLRRPLTDLELNALIRNELRGRTLQRVRARFGAVALDGYFEGLAARNAQVLHFNQPGSRANVGVGLAGAGVEFVDSIGSGFDLLLRGDVKSGSRMGLIEHEANDRESQLSVNVRAVGARFVGPDKILVEGSAGRDEITQHTPSPIERGQTMAGATVRYQMFRPLGANKPYERPIASRGSEFFFGTVRGGETFGEVEVIRHDVFVGGSLKGLPGGGTHTFDVTVQPTWFTYRRDGRSDAIPSVDPLLNRQLETFVTALYRVVDHENERNLDLLPRLVFLNAVGLWSRSRTQEGLDAFERDRWGVQIDSKLVGRQHGGMTWLISGRYEAQRFGRLARRVNAFGAAVNLGF